jgi:hypothetical protein
VTIAAVDVDGLHASVAGYVTQVMEDGGRCEFRLSPDTAEAAVRIVGESYANVESTSCGTLQVPIDELARGSWIVVLEYSSESLNLQSEPVAMEVP